MRIAVRKAPEGVVGIVHTRCTRVSEGPLVVLCLVAAAVVSKELQ